MTQLLHLFYQYGLLAMFVLILAEYACFPVSSEIVLPFAGAFAASQQISFFLLLPLSILAGLLGTSFCYFLGKKGGRHLLNGLSRRFPKTRKPIDSSCQAFEKYGTLAVGIGRVIPLCRTYVAFVAGAFGQSYVTFFFSSFIGILVWNSILIGIGYFFQENWNLITSYYHSYRDILLLVLTALFLIYLYRRITRPAK